MSTAAFSAYGTEVRVSDGGTFAPLSIQAATATTPIAIHLTAPHGVVDVSHGVITGAVGLTGLNGAWVLEAINTTDLRLRSSVGTGTYTGSGVLTIDGIFATIAELRDVQDAGSRTDLIDVSAHDGDGYSSEIPTLKRTNTIRLDINYVAGDPTHDETTGLMALYESGEYRDWLLVLPPYPGAGTKAAGHLRGFVSYYTLPLPVNGAVQAQVELAFDGAFTWTGG